MLFNSYEYIFIQSGYAVFNYASSGMKPSEYNRFIDYAKQRRGKNLDIIFLGLDFWTTNKNIEDNALSPDDYINKAQGPLYRYKTLVSLDSLECSIKNLFRFGNGREYNRQNQVMVLPGNITGIQEEVFRANAQSFADLNYGETYEYNQQIVSMYTEIINNNPGTRIVVFITPENYLMSDMIHSKGRINDYKKWITDCVDVFGGVYCFLYTNDVNSNLSNYVDYNHFNPDIGDKIADAVF